MNTAAKSSMAEKICYGLGGLGANFVWSFMSMFVLTYYTNSVGIAAAAAGTMMLVARLLDGVSDVFFAWVMQKVHFKMGRVKPWILISAPLLAVSLVLAFNIPGSLSDTGKIVYIYITYSFTAAVSYTIFNLAFAAYLPAMSFDPKDQVTASSIYNVITMGGVMALSMVTPTLLAMFGGIPDTGSWSKLSIIYALICLVGVTLMGLALKEKTPPETAEQAEAPVVAKKSFAETLKIIFSSKYTWMLLVVFFVFYLFSGASSGLATYYFMYVMGDMTLSTYALGSFPTVIVQMVMFFLLTKLVTAFGRKKIVIGGLLISIVGSLLLYINPSNLIVFIISACIKTAGFVPVMCIIYVYIADLVGEIAAKNNGFRPVETVSMVSSIGTKLGTGIGSALVGWTLSWLAVDFTAAAQSAFTINGIIAYTVFVPIITLGIIAIILRKWDLGVDAKQ